jgi:hypothetical protein
MNFNKMNPILLIVLVFAVSYVAAKYLVLPALAYVFR